ncbi:MAG: MoxR family ATPase [Propionibacterium sp.]|nr:MoxR family ATPase [Propionibacterium sp.]
MTLVLAGILAGGHVLLEDLPGLGKTLAARTLAQALGLEFTRAQFTPDLLPADLTGSWIYDQTKGEFAFREGPIFTGLLLADEINRTPPKTQSALLESMQERQVTVEGTTFQLPRPFHVLATANPIEHEGTYPLPEAQLDRFLLRLSFGYPDPDEEWDVLARRVHRKQEDQRVDAVCTPDRLLAMQASAEEIHVSDAVGRYAVDLARATRDHGDALVGASPRGSLALLLCSRALALIDGRDYVLPDDVKRLAKPALVHRITIRPELWMSDASPTRIVESVLATVPVPDAQEVG